MPELPTLTYLSFDSLSEGVGASQVLPYVEALARRGLRIVLHTFEKGLPSPDAARRLAAAEVTWHPHPFGRLGGRGGLARVLRGAWLLRGSQLVHARSDLAAASALLARAPAWVWDMRSFWTDQRIDQGMLRAGGIEERVLRQVERGAAGRATVIVGLAESARSVLAERHGPNAAAKLRVITTCVDLARFPATPLPALPPVRLTLAGSLNAFYDLPACLRFAEHLGALGPTNLQVLAPDPGVWTAELRRARIAPRAAQPAQMPGLLASGHAGLVLSRGQSEISLAGAMPTRIGEFLACGRPVVATRSIGDLDALLAEYRCGVLLTDTSESALRQGAADLLALLADPGLTGRCRALAEAHFSLEGGVAALHRVYQDVWGAREPTR